MATAQGRSRNRLDRAQNEDPTDDEDGGEAQHPIGDHAGANLRKGHAKGAGEKCNCKQERFPLAFAKPVDRPLPVDPRRA